MGVRLRCHPNKENLPRQALYLSPCRSNVMLNEEEQTLRVFLITVEQIRAARGLLNWSQSELAKKAGLSLPTVKRVEAKRGVPVSDEARANLQKALERAGIEFIEENGGGPGVRLRKSTAGKSRKSAE